MRIAVGSDHAGYEGPPPLFKPEIMRYLGEKGHTVVDCGTHGPESVDYPDFAQAVCDKVLSGQADAGVLMCGTGIGVAIAANRNRGIRAAVCANPEMARLSREHNNANILCLGRRILSLDECRTILDVWLATPFSNDERHKRRVCKMDDSRME
ncbi:MAG TPA: ribose 5-phosphate isomerase B [Candidatus Hydrogenedentes bacterium]|nr:ribose 5-phosphate isomerase B [Candidatus Hydrogenedentota bacterium]HQH53344.1 ribose 5-phosphate isomerase B [Candidatus Hydrogenedentota bacterium]